jgi:hypothetical protein
MGNAHNVLVVKSEGKPRRRWEDSISIRMDLKGWKVWIGCIWLRTGTNGGLL